MWASVSAAQFVKDTVLFAGTDFNLFVKTKWVDEFLGFLFCSLGLQAYFWYSTRLFWLLLPRKILNLGIMVCPALFLLFKTALTIQDLLDFHTKFSILFFPNLRRMLLLLWLDLCWICNSVGSIDILMMLILSIHKPGKFSTFLKSNVSSVAIRQGRGGISLIYCVHFFGHIPGVAVFYGQFHF